MPKVGVFRDTEGRIRSLSRDEYERLLSEPPQHLADMTQFSVATGLRQANETRLQWKQISLERRHLWVSATDHKNGRPHSVPLNQAAGCAGAAAGRSLNPCIHLRGQSNLPGQYQGLT